MHYTTLFSMPLVIFSPLLLSYINIFSYVLYLATSIAPYAFLKLAEGINEHLAQTCLILLSSATQHILTFKSAVVNFGSSHKCKTNQSATKIQNTMNSVRW